MPILFWKSALYVVHEPKENRDTVRYYGIDVYSIDGAQIIQWYISNEVMHIFDSNQTLTRLSLTNGPDRYHAKLTFIDSKSLSFLNNIKEIQVSGFLQNGVGLTDSSLTYDGKVISLERGTILFNQKDAKLTLLPNILFCIEKGKLTIASNPGSR